MRIEVYVSTTAEKQLVKNYESGDLNWADFVDGLNLIGKELTPDELQKVTENLQISPDSQSPQEPPDFIEAYYLLPLKYPDETQVAIEKVKATRLFLTAILDHYTDLSNITIKVVE